MMERMSLTLSATKTHYRSIFMTAAQLLAQQADQLINAQQITCTVCDAETSKHKLDHPLMAPSHNECPLVTVRAAMYRFLNETLAQQIMDQLGVIRSSREAIQCRQTGQCCRLASSEHSWRQLREKAAAGDSFAQQFTSVFLPYPSVEKAKEAFPAVVEQVLDYASRCEEGEQDVYFYHCPYVTDDNRCSLYGTAKRPTICSTYPETPLTFVHKHCAWEGWQQQYHEAALMAHASIELAQFWSDKLEASLKQLNAG